MRSSINVKYDYEKTDLVDNYIPTTSHLNLLTEIFGRTAKKAHIIYGPYGSGKSYISSLIVKTLTKSMNKQEIRTFYEKINEIDENLANDFIKTVSKSTKHIPLIVNGNEGEINNLIVNRVKSIFPEIDLGFNFKGIKQDIFEILQHWEMSLPLIYQSFNKKLGDNGIEIVDFKDMLSKDDSKAFELFSKLYKEVTLGIEFVSKNYYSMTYVIEKVVDTLKNNDLGLLLVFDEFGRYLQNMTDSTILKFIQELQDLAELANNGTDNLTVLFVTHKPISTYLTSFDIKNRNEFAKVEKRFNVKEISSDESTFYRIAEKYLKTKSLKVKELSQNLKEIVKKEEYFSDVFSDNQIESVIFNGLLPLHPITSYLLPKISKIFGQNERTLFTFLTDNLDKFNPKLHDLEFYYPDHLVDYFFVNIDDTYVENYIEYNTYKKSVDRINLLAKMDGKTSANRVYNFIFLWSLCRIYNSHRLNEFLIADFLDIPVAEVTSTLNTLEKLRLLRFNELENRYEIFESSQYDLPKRIKEIKSSKMSLGIDFVELINKYNPYRHIYSHQHNAENDITRYAFTTIYPSSEDVSSIKGQFDIFIPIVLDKNFSSHIFEYYATTNFSTVNLTKYCLEMEILMDLKNDKYLMGTYTNLESEIDYQILVLNKKMIFNYHEIYSKLTIFGHERIIKIRTMNEFSRFLSSTFNTIYDKSIRVVNDQVNMYKVSSIQLDASRKIFSSLYKFGFVDINASGLSNNQPGLLINDSMLLNAEVQKNPHFSSLSNEVNHYILSHPNGQLRDLFLIGIQRPYGLRPIISVLFTAQILSDKWADILLFKNDSYIANYNSDSLFNDIMEEIKFELSGSQDLRKDFSYNPITYSFSTFDNQNRDFLINLEKLFGSSSETVYNKSLGIKVCSSLYNWYINLPMITQQGFGLGLSETSLLNVIKKSRINPVSTIESLKNMYLSFDEIQVMKNQIESSFDKYKKIFVKQVLNELNIKDLSEWKKTVKPELIKINKIIELLSDDKDLFENLAEQVENIEIHRWTKSSFDNFKKFITDEYYKNIDIDNLVTIAYNQKELYIQNVELSTKGKVTLDNVNNIIDATKRYLTKSEVENIILRLLERYVK